MLSSPKPIHINLSGVDGAAVANDVIGIYTYETVSAAGNVAVKVYVPGMGAGPDNPNTIRSSWKKASWIRFVNRDILDSFEISFDNGNNFITVGPEVVFEANISFRFFFVRIAAGGGTANFECIVGINGPN